MKKCYVMKEGFDDDGYGQPHEWVVAVYLTQESAMADLEKWAVTEGAVRIDGPHPYFRVADGSLIDEYRCLTEEDLLD